MGVRERDKVCDQHEAVCGGGESECDSEVDEELLELVPNWHLLDLSQQDYLETQWLRLTEEDFLSVLATHEEDWQEHLANGGTWRC